MSDIQEFSVSLSLDSGGFLRRECPTCEREFKWLHAEDSDEEAAVHEGGYFCPYCAIQAPVDGWWTPAQLELVNGVITEEVVEPALKRLERSVGDVSRGSGGLITASMKIDLPPKADPLVESDDMRRIDYACHPTEPVKVLDDWVRTVHCLICGTPTSDD